MKKFRLFGTYVFKKDENEKQCAILNWNFRTDNNIAEEFIIERSTDNEKFEVIGKENKMCHSQRQLFYLFIDENSNVGKNYYRVFLKKKGASKKIISISSTIILNIPHEEPWIDKTEKHMAEYDLIY